MCASCVSPYGHSLADSCIGQHQCGGPGTRCTSVIGSDGASAHAFGSKTYRQTEVLTVVLTATLFAILPLPPRLQ